MGIADEGRGVQAVAEPEQGAGGGGLLPLPSALPAHRAAELNSPLHRNPEVRGHWKLSYSQK